MPLPAGSWLYCTDACGITERSEGYERDGAWRSSSGEALGANDFNKNTGRKRARIFICIKFVS
jgi:hypothetical protein